MREWQANLCRIELHSYYQSNKANDLLRSVALKIIE